MTWPSIAPIQPLDFQFPSLMGGASPTGGGMNMSGMAPVGVTDPGMLSSMTPQSLNFQAPDIAGGAGAAGGIGKSNGIGTMGYVNAGLSGLQTLGSLWMGLKQMKLANKQFNFSRDMANTNLANQMKTYNTALSDRARSRGFTEGQSQGQIDSYTAANSLSKTTH